MLLNSLSQAFVISFDMNFFYPEVCQNFLPLIHRYWLPYNTVEDFMNSQISQVTFPGFGTPAAEQSIGLNPISKRVARQSDEVIDRNLTLTIKTTESLLSYFICRTQYSEYLKLGRYRPLYMPDIRISLINDGGFETFTYVYHQLTPTNISQLDLSYASRLGQFNTFTWQFMYNFYDVWTTDGTGKRTKINDIFVPQYDGPHGLIDENDPQLQNKKSPVISAKSKFREMAMQFANSRNRNVSGGAVLNPNL